jgi:hypothetical protein
MQSGSIVFAFFGGDDGVVHVFFFYCCNCWLILVILVLSRLLSCRCASLFWLSCWEAGKRPPIVQCHFSLHPSTHLHRHPSSESSRGATERCASYPFLRRSSGVLKRDSTTDSKHLRQRDGVRRRRKRVGRANPGWKAGPQTLCSESNFDASNFFEFRHFIFFFGNLYFVALVSFFSF